MKDRHCVLHRLLFLLFLAAVTGPGFAREASCQTQPGTQSSESESSGAQTPQTVPKPAAPYPARSHEDDKNTKQDKKESKTTSESAGPGTSNDRLFFTLPNFLTLENAGRVPPLTSHQKFAVALRGSFDYVQYPWHAFLAGIS